jgi:hypothetical protein
MTNPTPLPALDRLRQRIERAARAWRYPLWPLCMLAIVLLSLVAVWPLFGDGLLVTGDTSHALRIYEMHRCLSDGQLPCRWVADLGNGYGYPLFNYYPPLPYYAGDLLHRLGFSYLLSANLLAAAALIGAGLSMYALTRRLWGDLGGLVSAVAYMYAPYLALDVYMRGALAELWALAVLPALFWSIYELIDSGRARFVPLTALFGALLLLSHNLIAVIAAPALGLWVAALLALRGRQAFRPALLGAVAGAWGLGLAAFFTLPALFEGDLVQLDTLSSGAFHYSRNFAPVRDLFLLRSADYSFLLGGREGTPLQIGWFHWGLAALALPVAYLLSARGRSKPALAIVLFAVFFAIGAFMSTSASKPIWDTFSALRFIQFPWRYLGLVTLAAAALAGAALALLRGRSAWLQAGAALALVALFVASGRMFFHTEYRLDISDRDLFSPQYFQAYQGSAITDYLPRDVEKVPPVPEARARVVDGSAVVVSARSGSDWLDLDIDARTPARIQASLFDFPNWRVRIDSASAPHTTSKPYGLIDFEVPPGRHHAELRLEDTRVRRVGNVLSLMSWAALLLGWPAFALGRRWVRRHLVN